ncbi:MULTISPECIES: hypothetical protein [unclassified Variovorax]|uniref:hypothetical protein n=1 Tax=unclassified Variovorax TaxID=663243 RepID=UPI00159E4A85|nr:hypothetical protein [Variovorax sp. SG517]NVM87463.1 hypothetical protein [Variovorax sp. SG517]
MMWLLAVLLGLAALLQFAVHTAPDIHDAPLRGKARRVKIAALSLLCGYFGWAAFLGQREHPWLLLAVALAAISELGFAINRLFPGQNNRLHGRDVSREIRHE